VSSVRGFRVAFMMFGFALLASAAAAGQASAQQQSPPPQQTPPPAPQTAPQPKQAPAPPAATTPAPSPAPATPAQPAGAQPQTVPTTGIEPPPGYVIGARDVLSIIFWRDKDMSADVSVRPDGKISLPLINEIHAEGLTPDQLRDQVAQKAARYVADPTVSVVVREINSRQVFITGEVNRPGAYSLMTPTSVMQLISLAGGLREYAKGKEIVILRNEAGKQSAIQFNYKDVVNRKKLTQNILLKPGDTVIVP
jgi:polysaccharide export outer membrane protein